MPKMDIENLESQKRVTSHSRGIVKSLILIWQFHEMVLQGLLWIIKSIQGKVLALAPEYWRNSETTVVTTSTQVALDILFSSENTNNNNLQYEGVKKIIKERDFSSFQEFGGASTLAEALGTDVQNGISSADQHLCCRRISRKSSNFQAPNKGLVFKILGSPNNYIVILLSLSGILSVGFGMKEKGPKTGWLEGVIVLSAVVIMVILPLIRDAMGLPRNHEDIREESGAEVVVIRGGISQKISASDLLLGDVVWLKSGCQIPADGLFVSGDSLNLDDGSMTPINESNPFLFYGAEVIRGEARMLVTCTGEDTLLADVINNATHFDRTESFTSRLDKLNTRKQIFGLLISVLVIVIQFLRFEFANNRAKPGIPDVKGKPIAIDEFRDMVKRIVMEASKISTLTTSLTVLLVGVVEGFPFCLSLAISYWSRKGLTFAREVSACVAMGSVTVIVTDLVGGVALEPLEVGKFLIAEEEMTEDSVIEPSVCNALCEGITASLLLPHPFITEIDAPIISWAVPKFCLKLETVRNSSKMVQIDEPTDSEGRGVLILKNNDDQNMSFHWRGLATKILPKCSFYHNIEGSLMEMDEQRVLAFQETIEHMEKSEQMKVIAFAYKPANVVTFKEPDGMRLLGLVGLKRRIREEIRESIRTCLLAGVRIVLVSPDDAENLSKIAQEFGILLSTRVNFIIRGEEFRILNEKDRMEIVSLISVMGNSLPSDRHQLVELLNKRGESVAVIGKSTSDVPTLKASDVGLAMGFRSNNVARASADIVSWDTSIGFVVLILRYGRGMYNNIRNYIRLELTMLLAGLLIAVITMASTGKMPITTSETCWMSSVVLMLGGVAVLVEKPSEEEWKNTIFKRNEAVITKAMWANIATQAMSQTLIILAFLFKGHAIFRLERKVRETIVFNSFVMCQVFNQFNGRDKLKTIHKKYWFWMALGVVVVVVVLQDIFIEIAHVTVGNARLNLLHWLICFVIGTVSVAMGWVGSFIFGFIMFA